MEIKKLNLKHTYDINNINSIFKTKRNKEIKHIITFIFSALISCLSIFLYDYFDPSLLTPLKEKFNVTILFFLLICIGVYILGFMAYTIIKMTPYHTFDNRFINHQYSYKILCLSEKHLEIRNYISQVNKQNRRLTLYEAYELINYGIEKNNENLEEYTKELYSIS